MWLIFLVLTVLQTTLWSVSSCFQMISVCYSQWKKNVEATTVSRLYAGTEAGESATPWTVSSTIASWPSILSPIPLMSSSTRQQCLSPSKVTDIRVTCCRFCTPKRGTRGRCWAPLPPGVYPSCWSLGSCIISTKQCDKVSPAGKNLFWFVVWRCCWLLGSRFASLGRSSFYRVCFFAETNWTFFCVSHKSYRCHLDLPFFLRKE